MFHAGKRGTELKRFFMKKTIFAICMLCCLFGLSILTLIVSYGSIEKRFEKLVNVSGIDELSEWIAKTEEELNSDTVFRMNFVEIYGGVQKLLGKVEYNNFTLIKGNDDILYYGSIVELENDNYYEYAKRIKRAAQTAKNKGAEVMFVLPPTKILYGVSNTENLLMLNDKNAAQDEFMLRLQERGVQALNLWEAFADSPLEIDELFYRTDHYWTTEGAFIAMVEVVESIDKFHGIQMDKDGFYSDRNNYNSEIYEQVSLGAMGKISGKRYAGLDNFTVLTPNFDTDFEYYDMEHNTVTVGSFEEAFIDIKEEEGTYTNYANHAYLSGVVDRDRIINKKNETGPKILCLRDGYFSPVACFLAPMCSQIDLVYADRGHNDIDYEQIIKEEEYDILIIESYPYNLDEESFDYFKE